MLVQPCRSSHGSSANDTRRHLASRIPRYFELLRPELQLA